MFDGASVVADGDGTVHPAAAAFVDQWLVVEYDGESRRFMPHVWMDDGDESMDALAWRAVTRGIQDYCRKNGFKKVWLGLSGGIDSALTLAVAVDALGADKVHAVMMPSPYTAGISLEDAREMARRCAREEGMLVGISSGATLAAIAQKLKDLPAGSRVLGFNYDTGERYLSVEGFLPV